MFWARRAASSGVVRIVKPSNSSGTKEEVDTVPNFGGPLINHESTPSRATGYVAPDVRVADVFRQYKRNPDKTKLISVLENLCVMGIQASVISKFPGFIQLLADLSAFMGASALTPEETLVVIENLGRIGLKTTTHGNGVDFASFEKALSEQLVSALDSVDRYRMVQCVHKLESVMRIHPDEYFYWALNKDITKWACDNSVSDSEYIRDVLGSLQLLAQPAVAGHMRSLLSNPAVENRIIDFVKANKLTNVQVIELVHNLKGSEYSQLVQMGISSVLSRFRPHLESSLEDLAHLISALPSNGALRDTSVQSDLCELLQIHISKKSESTRVDQLLKCVSELVVDPVAEVKILKSSAQVVTDHAAELNRMSANEVANLYYLYSVATVNSYPELRQVCRQLEPVVVGRLPKLDSPQLSRLALSFASGVVSNANSFKALGATIKRSVPEFGPSDFVDAAYGLAFKGLMTKSIFADADLTSIVRNVPVKSLPRLAWSMAVADLSAPTVWESILTRIDKQILSSSKSLGSLSQSEDAMLYEVLVAAKISNHGAHSKTADRRIAHFEAAWNPPAEASEADYGAILEAVNIPFQQDVPIKDKLRLYQLPIFIPEYKLVLDVTKTPVSESGLTNGSSKLRHSIWSKMGYNVIAISDSQYEPGSSTPDMASIVGSIISQFISEIDAVKVQPAASGSNRVEWDSRKPRDANYASQEQSSWGSRDDNMPPKQHRAKEANWSSRLE